MLQKRYVVYCELTQEMQECIPSDSTKPADAVILQETMSRMSGGSV